MYMLVDLHLVNATWIIEGSGAGAGGGLSAIKYSGNILIAGGGGGAGQNGQGGAGGGNGAWY